MHFYNSFNDLAAGTGAELLLSDMSVFNLDISYADSDVKAKCTAGSPEQKRLGADVAKMINQRLLQMQNADTLAELNNTPGRWHELTRDLKGNLACNVSAKERLIFRPTNNPLVASPNGALDWSKVTSVEIVDINDYHK